MPKSLLVVESEVLATGPVVKLGSVTVTPAVLFAPDAPELQTALDEIACSARSIPQDISTAAGRAAVISLAHKITRTKTTLGNIRKEYVAVLKAEPARVDKIGKRAWDFLEDLAAEIRKPVTEFEELEKKRLADLAAIGEKVALCQGQSSTFIEEVRAGLLALDFSGFAEFTEQATAARDKSLIEVEAILSETRQKEADAAELEDLRRKQAEQDRLDRERKIAEEAAAKAKKQADEEAAAKIAKAEKEAAEAKLEKERAERKAEEDRAAAKQREEQAEQDRLAAEAKAKTDQETAVLDAKVAAETERQRLEAEEIARQADQDNRARVFGEIKDTLARIVSPAQAGAIVDLLEAGMIPHVEIKW